MGHRTSSSVADLAAEVAEGTFSWDPVLGTLEGYGRYDGRLGSVTAESVTAMAASCRRWQAEAQRALGTGLDWDDRADLIALEAVLEDQIIELTSVCRWQRDPNWYGERVIYGCWALLTEQRDPAATSGPLVSRLKEVPRLLGQARANLVRPLASAVQSALAGAGAAEELLGSLGRQLPLDDREREALAGAGARALVCWREFCRWMEQELLPRATDDPGIPREAYERLLGRFHGLAEDGEGLLTVGREQVRAISELLRQQARTIRPDGDWRAALSDTALDCPEPGELLATYRRDVDRTVDFLEQRRLVTVPRDAPLVVEPTPAFGRALMPYAAYMPAGPFADDDRPGRLWVTPVDEGLDPETVKRLLKSHNRHSRLLLALHEGYPGHHLQLAVARRTGRPARWLAQFPTFVEGWAFYCEQMLVEQGLLSEPGDLLWQLRDELWRAARIVVDASYHCRGMTVAAGQRYLVDEVGMEPEHALAEASWYAGRPSYPMAYMMGKREILSLRRSFLSQRRGSLGEFHDRLMNTGGLPIRLAAERLLS